MDRSAALNAFGDRLALYDVRSLDAGALVDAATALIVSGFAGDAVVALASAVLTNRTNPFEFDGLVRDARTELDMPVLDSDRVAIRATQAQLRRWLQDELTDRELTRWAFSIVEADGPEILQALVETEYLLDELECVEATAGSVHLDLKRLAGEILALTDPWAQSPNRGFNRR